MLLHGIDVSHWNGEIDCHALAEAGLSFIFVKATQGDSMVDPQFERTVSVAPDAGLIPIPYHYFTATSNGAAQAKHFLSVTDGFNGLAGDFEDAGSMSSRALCASIQAFLNVCKAETGLDDIFYTFPSFNTEHLRPVFGNNPLWAASYPREGLQGSPVNFPGWGGNWTFWQWTDHGLILGNQKFARTGGSLDLDVFNGTLDELKALVKWTQ